MGWTPGKRQARVRKAGGPRKSHSAKSAAAPESVGFVQRRVGPNSPEGGKLVFGKRVETEHHDLSDVPDTPSTHQPPETRSRTVAPSVRRYIKICKTTVHTERQQLPAPRSSTCQPNSDPVGHFMNGAGMAFESASSCRSLHTTGQAGLGQRLAEIRRGPWPQGV